MAVFSTPVVSMDDMELQVKPEKQVHSGFLVLQVCFLELVGVQGAPVVPGGLARMDREAVMPRKLVMSS